MKKKLTALVAMMVLALLAACSQPQEVEVEVTRLVPEVVEVTRLVTETMAEEVEVTRVVVETAVEEVEVTRIVEVPGEPASGSVLTVEVVENGNRFSPDESPVFEDDGLPAYGGEFVTEGFIYPAGTITCDDNGCNGILADGSPEFPEMVIGTWVCRGWFVGDGAHTETGPWVATKQIYSFGTVPGAEILVTDGFELSDLNVVGNRAIIGGTGSYLNVRGQQEQTLLGFNESLGVALQISFNLILDAMD